MLDRPNITFAAETFEQFWHDAEPFFGYHYAEVAKDKQVMRLDPDVELYREKSKAGQLIFVTARDHGVLIGYFAWFLHPHPHYKELMVAQSDVYYLSPLYRGQGYGTDLFEAATRFAREAGAQYCFISTKVGHDHPALMARLNLKPRDLIYGGPL